MLLHLSALIPSMRGLSMSSPRCPCPVFCMYLSVEACLSPSLPFAVFALRLVGCDNLCCSSLVLSITAGSGRFPAVNSHSIYVPFGLVNSKKNKKNRDDPDRYRPITLLNCDVKLVAKVMVLRMGNALDTVIDGTQTAFVPGRWIGDNVLFHLEELEYVQATQAAACIVGLDYNKAYDRVHRGWLDRCMEALGVPLAARRWVSLLLQGTRGLVVFNGWTSRPFPIYLSWLCPGQPTVPLIVCYHGTAFGSYVSEAATRG